MKSKLKVVKYEFIGKCLYFPLEKILCVGDLHLGFERMLHEDGVMFPMDQLEIVKEELRGVFEEISRRSGIEAGKVSKIVLLGDVKHYFKFDKGEKNDFFKLLDFLRGFVEDGDDKNIIIIKGNHDVVEIGSRFRDYYIDEDLGIGFLHGHKLFSEVLDVGVKVVVMGHLHSSITIKDKQDVKSESYKCFLVGKWRGKVVIGVPSFLPFIEGGRVSDYKGDDGIMDPSKLNEFEVFVVNNKLDEKALGFGKLGNF